jgi:hypothetical protein
MRLHPFEDGADDATDYATLHYLFAAFSGEILLDLMGEARDGQRLQPHAARAGERREKNAIAAEDHVLDARHTLNLKRNAGLKSADVARVYAQCFTRCEVLDDEFTGEFKPRDALSADLLQPKAIAAEDTRAKRLLESNAELDVRGGT